ncbi:succinyldiaminopimelate transaminase [Pseudofrankia inefficax]|uniref:Aminotransferase n=1 Tax=Pseudofrankia inefficax (strain DSM 45817 / CECT 9037 / DDB 130130 / EuI1c) TaxID=298654 RepID=E3ITN3_PSEI1|nr:succinyldiaminopimelate transaminase [Pseudofrankia inefficax]ADP78790.1 succinyldiaminopimelate transaminase [Pseudofrankia inefficax]
MTSPTGVPRTTRAGGRAKVRLPDFPWDTLAQYKQKASQHPYGLVDLSVGTPVDPVPAVIQRALAAAADSPGYPQVWGTPELRDAAAGWMARRLGVRVDPSAVLPVLGTKELVAQLPTQLGLGPGDRVWVPTPAYPTYEVGALLARCEPVYGPADGVALVWLNSPSNPTGRCMSVEEMRAVVGWARQRGVIVASDECYIELGWENRAVSVLHPDVCGGSHEGLLAVHSLSKRSNLAGYRAGFVAGDPVLVRELLELRKHSGFMLPGPVQAAMTAGLADDMHVADQRARYVNRRTVLAAALAVAGFTIEHSEAGLYLWATRGEDAWATVDALASVGVLVAPGTFYGEAGRRHVRVALTAPDAHVATVPERMAMLPPPRSAAPATGPRTGGYAYPPAGQAPPTGPVRITGPGGGAPGGHQPPAPGRGPAGQGQPGYGQSRPGAGPPGPPPGYGQADHGQGGYGQPDHGQLDRSQAGYSQPDHGQGGYGQRAPGQPDPARQGPDRQGPDRQGVFDTFAGLADTYGGPDEQDGPADLR